jgi:beta-glucanase (GH16 family)
MVGRPRWTARAAALLIALTAASCSASGATPPPGGGRGGGPADGWRQVWADEFDGGSLEPLRWQVEDRSTFGDGNLALACLMDRPENVSVSGGVLHLTARREPGRLRCGDSDPRFPDGRSFSSGMVSTRDRASWTSGRFEIRARLPTRPGRSQGLWPALWLRPVDGGQGEIDIMEAVGSRSASPATRIHQTVWSGEAGHLTKESTTATLPSGTTDAAFHVYGLEWSQHAVTFTIDGTVTFRRTDRDVPWLAADDRPFFLRLNVAVGGRWPGAPSPSTTLPASMDVDYVRVFQRVR